jgi:inhibitor of KinA
MQAVKTNIAPPFIYYLNEYSVTIEFGSEISQSLFLSVSIYNYYILTHPFPGFITTIPAYASLTVVFDPMLVMQSGLEGAGCFEKVSAYLTRLNPGKIKPTDIISDTVNIPVYYGGTFGPDIADVASLHQLSTAEVISLHSAGVYTVYMIGFVPGFAYLGGMNELLTCPRKATPRKAVPSGSVGIAGQQTGVYPMQTPGGWQIIGQTPLNMFDAERAQPSLLKAGDKVMFKPIGLDEFNDLKAGR